MSKFVVPKILFNVNWQTREAWVLFTVGSDGE